MRKIQENLSPASRVTDRWSISERTTARPRLMLVSHLIAFIYYSSLVFSQSLFYFVADLKGSNLFRRIFGLPDRKNLMKIRAGVLSSNNVYANMNDNLCYIVERHFSAT